VGVVAVDGCPSIYLPYPQPSRQSTPTPTQNNQAQMEHLGALSLTPREVALLLHAQGAMERSIALPKVC